MVDAEKEFGWSRILPILQREKFLLEPHMGQKSVSMHDHAFLELTYVQSGTVEHTLDGQTTVLHAGDYLIVDYGSRHCYRALDDNGFDKDGKHKDTNKLWNAQGLDRDGKLRDTETGELFDGLHTDGLTYEQGVKVDGGRVTTNGNVKTTKTINIEEIGGEYDEARHRY